MKSESIFLLFVCCANFFPMKRNEFLNPNVTLLRVLVKSLPWEVLSTLQHSLTSQPAPKQTEGKVLGVPAQP